MADNNFQNFARHAIEVDSSCEGKPELPDPARFDRKVVSVGSKTNKIPIIGGRHLVMDLEAKITEGLTNSHAARINSMFIGSKHGIAVNICNADH